MVSDTNPPTNYIGFFQGKTRHSLPSNNGLIIPRTYKEELPIAFRKRNGLFELCK